MRTGKGAEHAARIMDALRASPRPLGAYDLLAELRPSGVAAPLTVYRALDRLVRSGKVHRIESLNAFVACRQDDHEHDHHPHDQTVGFAICDECGAAEEFVDPHLGERLRESLVARGFVPRASAVEVRGLCRDCDARRARDERPAAASNA